MLLLRISGEFRSQKQRLSIADRFLTKGKVTANIAQLENVLTSNENIGGVEILMPDTFARQETLKKYKRKGNIRFIGEKKNVNDVRIERSYRFFEKHEKLNENRKRKTGQSYTEQCHFGLSAADVNSGRMLYL